MKPPVSDDVKTLFRRFGGEASTYQEVHQEQHNKQVESKWPMLMSIDPDRALVVPSVKRAIRISEVRHEVADFDGTDRRMAVAIPSESSFQKKPGGRRGSDATLAQAEPSSSPVRPAIQEPATTATPQRPRKSAATELPMELAPEVTSTKPPARKTRAATARKVNPSATEAAVAPSESRSTLGAGASKIAQPKSLLSLFGRIKHPADPDPAPAPAEAKGLFKRRAS
jgi:resuscitation-promoting factor RpfA